MIPRLTPEAIADAFRDACRLDVHSLKPGNVHIHADGHGMQVSDFDKSAAISAPFIADPELKTGAKVLAAMDATWAAVGCNTNLGILLLCAPVASAAHRVSDPSFDLETVTQDILQALDSDDARDAYAAIARANPGGLGSAAQNDVRDGPQQGVTLLDAMRAAADRDLIALQYATGFTEVFRIARALEEARAVTSTREEAMTRVFLGLLARVPDTHIARKFGVQMANAVRQRAEAFRQQHSQDLDISPFSPAAFAALAAFDKELKVEGLNPGSLADLTVAAAFVLCLSADRTACSPSPGEGP